VHLFLDPANLILSVVGLGLLVLKVYAFIDCLRRPAAAFVAYGKLTKPAWLAITGAAALFQLLFGGALGLFSIVGTVAAIVYLVDVKPAVSGTSNPWS
jgi:hypothetical protein